MPHPSTPLSKNFTLKEFLCSETAERDERLKQEQENPPSEIVENLQYLVHAALHYFYVLTGIISEFVCFFKLLFSFGRFILI